MTCPACGGELVEGGVRCPVCDAPVAPRVEGALAADPRLVTPPARGRARGEAPAGEAIREIPGLRREPREPREPREARDAWREEVRDRIRSRHQKRASAGLPLFDNLAGPAPAATASSAADTVVPPRPAATDPGEVRLERGAAPQPRLAEPPAAVPEPPPTPPLVVPAPPPAVRPPLAEGALVSPGLSEAELADLPLRTGGPPRAPAQQGDPGLADAVLGGAPQERPRRGRLVPVAHSLGDEILVGEGEGEPEIALEPPPLGLSPVERPARALERAQAAAVDLALFTALGAVVVYFAGRAARVEATSLAVAWPWLVCFLGLLAVFYAGYFTGTTGQTPGKLLTGLRVVGTSGRPPGYPRAAGRAVAGFLGVVTAGAGLLPILFDPARRALHDRLFRTRVVRR